MPEKTHSRAARSMIALTLAITTAGMPACATRAVHRKWLGYDRVVEVMLTLERATSERVAIALRLRADDDRTRSTKVDIDTGLGECDGVSVVASYRGRRWPLQVGQPVRVDVGRPASPESEVLAASEQLPERSAVPACTVELVLQTKSEGEPRVSVVGSVADGEIFEGRSPRRGGWIPVHPMAATADVVGVTIVVALVLTIVLPVIICLSSAKGCFEALEDATH